MACQELTKDRLNGKLVSLGKKFQILISTKNINNFLLWIMLIEGLLKNLFKSWECTSSRQKNDLLGDKQKKELNA